MILNFSLLSRQVLRRHPLPVREQRPEHRSPKTARPRRVEAEDAHRDDGRPGAAKLPVSRERQ